MKAAEHGRINILDHLYPQVEALLDDETKEGIAENAASWGQIRVLEWAVDKCPIGQGACAAAAKNDRLDCLVWLHNHNANWSALTCKNAIRGGYLRVLKYAREHGCPWTRDIWDLAHSSHDVAIRQWAEENPFQA